MVNARGIARLGMFALGLGVGAAVVSTPGIAGADSTDWLSSIDGLLGGLSVPAQTSDLNLAISFNGDEFVHDGNATATTVAGEYGYAIAYGNDASATANDGTGNYALAEGNGAIAYAAEGNDNSAVAEGANAQAYSGGFYNTNGNGDSASAHGDNSYADADYGSHDSAYVNDPSATTSSPESIAYAIDGNDNHAYVFGDDPADARAGGVNPTTLGNNDIAEVVGNGSHAAAGANPSGPGDFDLGAAFGNDLSSTGAIGASHLYDIVTTLGTLPGSAAADSGTNFLADLLALF